MSQAEQEQVLVDVPFPRELIQRLLDESGFTPDRLSIREVNRLAQLVEEETGTSFIRMEMGVPSIPPPEIAMQAEIEALHAGHHGKYAPFDGVPRLKQAGARFFKAFLGVEVTPECVVPTCGAMQGGFIAQALAGRLSADRGTILFLEPSFPVTKLQTRYLGLAAESIDLYDHRGDTLLAALERRLDQGDVGGVIWSSPNNPAWVCLTEEELAGIASRCDAREVLAIEDQAYLGMDFRKDYSRPGEEPYIPTVARHGEFWVSLISASKIFSYPGPRCALAVLSPALLKRDFEGLGEVFGTSRFLHAFAHGALYVTTAGVSHTSQHALATLLDATTSGEHDFIATTRLYADRCHTIRELFLANDFTQVYDRDLDEPVGDGFYLTMAYPGMGGQELLWELLHYGISAITLASTGSIRSEGLRLCVSFVTEDQIPSLQARLERFRADHPA